MPTNVIGKPRLTDAVLLIARMIFVAVPELGNWEEWPMLLRLDGKAR